MGSSTDSEGQMCIRDSQKKPGDMRYQARLDRMRFQAAAVHVDRGRVLRQSGDIAGALNQFTRALQIDPGNEAAAQEIRSTENADKANGAAAVTAPPGAAESSAVVREIASVAAPLVLKPLPTDPITLHMVEDTKNIYTCLLYTSCPAGAKGRIHVEPAMAYGVFEPAECGARLRISRSSFQVCPPSAVWNSAIADFSPSPPA